MSKLLLVNKVNGEMFQPHCKSYTCPTHGWKRRKDLEKGIAKWLKQFDYTRLITFTAKFVCTSNIQEHNRKFQRAWHRFITELRRNKMLSKREQNVQYIKVYEYHKSGALHIHALFSEFIHWSKVQALWQYSLERTVGGSGKLGNVNMKGQKNAEKGAKYVAKYVVKMAHDRRSRIRAWSKSGNVALFKKRKSTGEWIMVKKGTLNYDLAWQGLPMLEIGIPNVTDVTHLFDGSGEITPWSPKIPKTNLFTDFESSIKYFDYVYYL